MIPTLPAPAAIRDALVAQWERIAAALGSLDLDVPSRVFGWRNREVVAHLALQPTLLERFLRTSSPADGSEHTLAHNLVGTSPLRQAIDAAAKGASVADLDFSSRLRRAVPTLLVADLSVTVRTIQGPIALADYLATRCVEAVVHGGDLTPPVQPGGAALAVAAESLLVALAACRPDLVGLARAMLSSDWVDQASGRARPQGVLADALPLMG